MNPFSMDLRKRIAAAVKAGETKAQVARRFQVCPSTVGNYTGVRFVL